MSTKGHVLSPSSAGTVRWESLGGGARCRVLQSVGDALKGDHGSQAPVSLPLLLPGHEVKDFTPPSSPAVICCLATGPKQ